MRVNSIREIESHPTLIYYNRKFSAVTDLDLVMTTVSVPIRFEIEKLPLGGKKVYVSLGREVNYPTIPVIKNLKREIVELDSRGRLP